MSARNHKTRVTIGLPVYNGARYLAAALDSLLAQTYGDFELILCDNASTDDTERICRAYAEKDRRIRYVRNDQNVGSAKNYMRALSLAATEYFRWATYDDLSAPQSLERCVDVLDQMPDVVLTYPKTQLIDENGQALSTFQDGMHLVSPHASERFKQALLRLRLCNVIYGLMRTEALRKANPLGTFIGSDMYYVAELSLYGKFWEIPEYLFSRRMHSGASSSYTTEQLQQFYDPGRTAASEMLEWKVLATLFQAIRKAPLGWREKRRLYSHWLRVAAWSREGLFKQLAAKLQSEKA